MIKCLPGAGSSCSSSRRTSGSVGRRRHVWSRPGWWLRPPWRRSLLSCISSCSVSRAPTRSSRSNSSSSFVSDEPDRLRPEGRLCRNGRSTSEEEDWVTALASPGWSWNSLYSCWLFRNVLDVILSLLKCFTCSTFLVRLVRVKIGSLI